MHVSSVSVIVEGLSLCVQAMVTELLHWLSTLRCLRCGYCHATVNATAATTAVTDAAVTHAGDSDCSCSYWRSVFMCKTTDNVQRVAVVHNRQV
jgi:hypothetical protein